jgi:Berberine and berberine like
VAGWIQGGGHGPYTSVYGLGADNALEFDIALTNGTLVTTNEDSYPDLFWALRGGGGSTFGVVTRITMRTFPRPDVASLTIMVGALERNTFLNAMAYWFAMTPNMSDYGISGYTSMTPMTYSGYLALPGKNSTQLQAFLDPIVTKMRSYGATVTFLGSNSKNTGILKRDDMRIPDVMAEYHQNRGRRLVKRQKLNFMPVHDLPVADMASRLLSRKALSVENLAEVKAMLVSLKGKLLPYGNLCGKVTKNAHLDIGLNPAWRQAAMHIIALDYDIKHNTEQLDRLSADHAAYFNEGFDHETDWKTTYFGPPEHYARLLAVKRKYDPTNTLWCTTCVGQDVFLRHEGKLYHAEEISR